MVKNDKFEKYFLMNQEDVKEYAKEKLEIFSENSELDVKEIGDGNLNYVYRVIDLKSGKSVIIKQAGTEARISSKIKLSVDRTRIESEVLIIQDKLAPGFVPKVYKYDDIMSACSMEDLSEYTIMRTALLNHEIFPMFSDHISTFMVRTLLLTTDICLKHKEKKLNVQRYINPELCEITEELVYTEPYNDIMNRNNVFSENIEFVKKELYEDRELHLEVAKCKFDFMNNAQSLIHGDLHTGSIFITKESTKVIDPEFSFYAPMGYDIGNVIANLYFAWNNGNSTIDLCEKKEKFIGWIEKTIFEIIDMFIIKYNKLFELEVKDEMAKVDGFKEWYLKTILKDTAAVTGLELIRRTVGLANVKDITTIKNKEKRKKAERICILLGKEFIMNRENYKTAEDFKDVIQKVLKDKRIE